MDNVNKNKFIPLDKSWIIRMGILDLIHGYKDINNFLANQDNLNDDLLALKRAVEIWDNDKPIDVGESGTLYRFLKFISWKLKLNKKFIISGTLGDRGINDNPKIVELTQAELLKLDNGTSQWASAAVLLGDTERLENPPYKLAMTYEAIDHWNNQRQKGEVWTPKYDETILKQAESFLEILKNGEAKFLPKQAEDYCFAFAFSYITAGEGEKSWPSLRGHESDRIKEMNEMLDRAKTGEEVSSKDHRVIQAMAMWAKVKQKEVRILYPKVVNKSWPQFWDFLESAAKEQSQ